MRTHPDLVVQVALSLGYRPGILMDGQFLMHLPLTHLTQEQELGSLLVCCIQVGDAPVTAFASSWKGDLASCILPESHQVMGRESMAVVASIVVFVLLDCPSTVTQLAACSAPLTLPSPLGFRSHSDLVCTRE